MLDNLPDISFIDTNVEEILIRMVAEYEAAYFEQTGVRKKLYPGDPIRLFLYTQAMREMQLRMAIDHAAKQNLLAYSIGTNLDHLGAFWDVFRLDSQRASVMMLFTLSAPQPVTRQIPTGTRVSPDDNLYFATNEIHEIKAGQTEVFVPVFCLEDGEIGNGYMPGQINILVDPLPWIESVENIEESKGGAELESDDSFRERIRLAPESYSVAGPTDGYYFHAKSYNSLISDVSVLSPSPGVVDIRVLLQDGELPNEAMLEGLLAHLSSETIRPLTDFVQVNAPEVVTYNVDVTYYILNDNGTQEAAIRQAVEHAVRDYIQWQKSKIGRDINPSELIAQMIRAGAKRVNVSEPIFTRLDQHQVGIENEVHVNYGGLENE